MTTHEDHDQAPYDEAQTEAQVAAIATILASRGGDARVLDLGCGRGRIGGPLARLGMDLMGVDSDSNHRDAYLEAVGSSGRFEIGDLAGPHPTVDGGYDAVLLLGNVVMTIREPAVLRRVLAAVTAVLATDGVVVMDDFAEGGWEEIASGRWADGIDDSGTMQMVWLPGDPEFVVRSDDEVDPDRTTPGEGERVLRLWSRRELDDAAGFAGLGPARHDPEGLVAIHARVQAPTAGR